MSTFVPISELRMGQVVEVSGSSLLVELAGDVAELTRSYGGRVYPIGQVGSIVKVHFGRRMIFGLVTRLRLRMEEGPEGAHSQPVDAEQRVMDVQLFSEGTWSSEKERLSFRRGVSTYPLPRQGVYLLTRDETTLLFEAAEGQRDPDQANPLVPFARYVGSDSVECRANIDKMFGHHCAVLGSTGAGKSCAVSAVLHSVLAHEPAPEDLFRPSIIIIDPHDEYGAALGNRASVYRAYDSPGDGHDAAARIDLPYWLMSADEFRSLLIGKTEFEATSQHNTSWRPTVTG